MEATELRLGNLITRRSNVEEVLTVDIDLLVKVQRQGFIFHPVPLTEQWLSKLGFKPFVKDFQRNGIIIHTRKRGFILRKSVPIIKYVHQLQNLYFALKGQEIELNETDQ